MTTVGRLMYDRSISAKLWYVCNHVNEERCLNTILNQNRTNIDITKVKQHHFQHRSRPNFVPPFILDMARSIICIRMLAYYTIRIQ
jgi:hypothetical protein